MCTAAAVREVPMPAMLWKLWGLKTPLTLQVYYELEIKVI